MPFGPLPPAARCLAVLVTLLTLGGGCRPAIIGGGVFDDGAPCARTAQCEAGRVCLDGACRQACNSPRQCARRTDACVAGICTPVADPECKADETCKNAPECLLNAGAECYGGKCHYPPAEKDAGCSDYDPCTENDVCDGLGTCAGKLVDCISPPLNQCRDNDTTFRVYSGQGTCNHSTGACEYNFTDSFCANCRGDCLKPCQNLVCDDVNGGCRGSGACDSSIDPARCVYATVEPDATPCILDGDLDSIARGICDMGECVDCLTNGDCIHPPGSWLPGCFSASCDDGHVCHYSLREARVCQPTSCADGTIFSQRVCGPTGSCPATNEQSCGSFTCAADALTCLTVCTGDSDCVSGYYCAGNNTCVAKGGPGQACNSGLAGRDCGTGHCQNGHCCASGNCCQTNTDCSAFDLPLSCFDQAHCQGASTTFVCNASSMCEAQVVGNDSACAGLLADTCGNYRDYVCSSAAEQPQSDCFDNCDGTSPPDYKDLTRCDPSMQCNYKNPTVGNVCELPASASTCCPDGGSCTNCGIGFHCGNTQVPPVNLCCPLSSRCCATDNDCQGFKCTTSTRQCIANCGDDDAKCATLYHCLASDGRCYSNANSSPCDSDGECSSGYCRAGVCRPKLTNGARDCLDGGDCVSGACVTDYGTTFKYCMPANTCPKCGSANPCTLANYATSFALDVVACTGNASYRRCTSTGWSAQVDNPYPSATYYSCLSSPYGGYCPSGVCTQGTSGGFSTATCVCCNGLLAESTSACRASCLPDQPINGGCAPGYHCYDGDGKCYTSALGQRCDVATECDFGVCNDSYCDCFGENVACGSASQCCNYSDCCDYGYCSLSDCGY